MKPETAVRSLHTGDREPPSRPRRFPVSCFRFPVSCFLFLSLSPLLPPSTAHAQPAEHPTIVVGLYSPSAPFAGPAERLQYISTLAAHLQPAAGGGRVVGRVYARAGDFAAAIRKGDVTFAVVDAPYAAARGLPWTPLAAATVGGRATGAWIVVAPPSIKGIADLRGKVVSLPRTGAGETAFLTNALLEGEVGDGFFARIAPAPDSFAAATMVKLGQAAAAVVPTGVAVPAGLRQLVSLRRVGWPMLVALPGADRALAAAIATRARSFTGPTLEGMTAPDQGEYKALVASLGKRSRKPIMATPKPPRFGVKGLLEGRAAALPGSDLSGLLVEPTLD